MTSKSIARDPDFDAKVVHHGRWNSLSRKRDICEKLTERSVDDDTWTRMRETPIKLGSSRRDDATLDVLPHDNLEADRDLLRVLGRDDSEKIWSDALDPAIDDRIEAIRSPFKWHPLSFPKGNGFILNEPPPENKRDHHGTQTPNGTEHDRENCIRGTHWAGGSRDVDRNIP